MSKVYEQYVCWECFQEHSCGCVDRENYKRFVKDIYFKDLTREAQKDLETVGVDLESDIPIFCLILMEPSMKSYKINP